jgi:superfamily I DNA/RNA helicase
VGLRGGVFDAYQQTLRKCNAVDFNDLLTLVVNLLQEHPRQGSGYSLHKYIFEVLLTRSSEILGMLVKPVHTTHCLSKTNMDTRKDCWQFLRTGLSPLSYNHVIKNVEQCTGVMHERIRKMETCINIS